MIFYWKGPGKKSFQGEGVTRDMSVTGAFILTPTCPPEKAVVKVEILLSSSEGVSSVLMTADMMVLRVEHDTTADVSNGFSVVGKGFALRAVSRLHAGPITGPEKLLEDQNQN